MTQRLFKFKRINFIGISFFGHLTIHNAYIHDWIQSLFSPSSSSSFTTSVRPNPIPLLRPKILLSCSVLCVFCSVLHKHLASLWQLLFFSLSSYISKKFSASRAPHSQPSSKNNSNLTSFILAHNNENSNVINTVLAVTDKQSVDDPRIRYNALLQSFVVAPNCALIILLFSALLIFFLLTNIVRLLLTNSCSALILTLRASNPSKYPLNQSHYTAMH